MTKICDIGCTSPSHKGDSAQPAFLVFNRTGKIFLMCEECIKPIRTIHEETSKLNEDEHVEKHKEEFYSRKIEPWMPLFFLSPTIKASGLTWNEQHEENVRNEYRNKAELRFEAHTEELCTKHRDKILETKKLKRTWDKGQEEYDEALESSVPLDDIFTRTQDEAERLKTAPGPSNPFQFWPNE